MEGKKLRGRPKGSKNKPKSDEEKPVRNPAQLKFNFFPKGRPKGKKNKNTPIKPMVMPKGLRLKNYENKLSSMGVYVSGTADQYGRILEQFVNDKNEWDLRPTGHCISVYH